MLDQDGILLPKRIYLKETCILKYREYINDEFVYVPQVDGGCPYDGVSYYDLNGNATTIDKDECGHAFPQCTLRFGANATLPFLAFKGLKEYD